MRQLGSQVLPWCTWYLYSVFNFPRSMKQTHITLLTETQLAWAPGVLLPEVLYCAVHVCAAPTAPNHVRSPRARQTDSNSLQLVWVVLGRETRCSINLARCWLLVDQVIIHGEFRMPGVIRTLSCMASGGDKSSSSEDKPSDRCEVAIVRTIHLWMLWSTCSQ